MAVQNNETTVNESYAVTIPAAVRDDLDLEPGDRLQWEVDDGALVATIIRERHGGAADLDPVDMGETDAVSVTEEYEWS